MSKLEAAYYVFILLPWSLIGGWFIYSLLVVFNTSFRLKYSNYLLIQSIPNVFVTLGLLGTFMGITYGLLFFNTSPDLIRDSIQYLLGGLKTALFTSITGIFLSIIFAKIIKVKISQKVISPHDSLELIELRNLNKNFIEFKKEISTTQYQVMVEAMKEVLKDFNSIFKEFIGDLVNENFKEFNEAIDTLVKWQQENKEINENLISTYKELVTKHTEFTVKTEQWVSNLDEIAGQSSKLRQIINQFNEAFNEDGNMSKILEEIKEAASRLNSSLTLVEETTHRMHDTGENMVQTSNKVTEWTQAVENVSDSSKVIIEKLEAMQTINLNHIDSLVEQFNSSLKGTFKTFDGLILEYIENVERRLDKLKKK